MEDKQYQKELLQFERDMKSETDLHLERLITLLQELTTVIAKSGSYLKRPSRMGPG